VAYDHGGGDSSALNGAFVGLAPQGDKQGVVAWDAEREPSMRLGPWRIRLMRHHWAIDQAYEPGTYRIVGDHVRASEGRVLLRHTTSTKASLARSSPSQVPRYV
jgi:hypothetical protein